MHFLNNFSVNVKMLMEFPLWCSRLRIQHCLHSNLGHCRGSGLIPCPMLWVKGWALLQLWHRLQLQLGINPWPKLPHANGSAKGKKKKILLKNLMYLKIDKSPPCEDTGRRQPPARQEKRSHQNQSGHHLILDFPSSRTMRK